MSEKVVYHYKKTDPVEKKHRYRVDACENGYVWKEYSTYRTKWRARRVAKWLTERSGYSVGYPEVRVVDTRPKIYPTGDERWYV